MNDKLGFKMFNLCVAYMDVGEGREQGCGSVTGDSRLDLDHFDSQFDSPRPMQSFPKTMHPSGLDTRIPMRPPLLCR